MGCDLGPEKCLSDDKLASKSFNFVNLRSFPSLIGDDIESVISYTQDFTYFKFIDPTRFQGTNLFFMESTIVLKDDIFDIFDANE